MFGRIIVINMFARARSRLIPFGMTRMRGHQFVAYGHAVRAYGVFALLQVWTLDAPSAASPNPPFPRLTVIIILPPSGADCPPASTRVHMRHAMFVWPFTVSRNVFTGGIRLGLGLKRLRPALEQMMEHVELVGQG